MSALVVCCARDPQSSCQSGAKKSRMADEDICKAPRIDAHTLEMTAVSLTRRT